MPIRIVQGGEATPSEIPDLFHYRPQPLDPAPPVIGADVVVYGATVAGIAAAVQLRRTGLDVVVLEFGGHVGGMTTSGLGRTDFGAVAAVGGLTRKLYSDIGEFYAGPGQGRGATEVDGAVWYFEPHVAEHVLQRWLDEAGVEVRFRQHLAEVAVAAGTITAVTTEAGARYEAVMFIDASYEGDLLARSGVTYRVGREANTEWQETLNGIQFGSKTHRFDHAIDPYLRPGRPDSGLLPLIGQDDPGLQGTADRSVQAYNFRMCLTDRPDIRLPFPEPTGYDPARYELLGRYINSGIFDALDLNVRLANGKTDLNNRGAVSTDHIGANHAYPDGDYTTRQEIFDDHVRYTMGLLCYLQNHDGLPARVRTAARQWGLSADEFTDTGHWPRQLYIREARRMSGEFVMSERNILGTEPVDDPIALGAYALDSHNCRRLVVGGLPVNEGNVETRVPAPYGISMGSILPQGSECTNLVVPVCVSATHIAFGSIRMEPVFLALGQAAGLIASMALAGDRPVQDLRYPDVREALLAAGQVLAP